MGATPVVNTLLSYAADDRRTAEDLWKKLGLALSTSGTVTWRLWAFSGQLLLGEEWHRAVQDAIDESSLGLFAISNSFLSSEYIRDHELPRFVESDGRKRVAPIMLRPLPSTADLRGLEARQIFGYHQPYSNCRGLAERERWVNHLADELHRVVDRYGLGR